MVVYEDKVEITLCYGNDLLKLVADDYGKDNSLRFRIVEFIPARILDKRRKHNFFQNCVFSGGEGAHRYLAVHEFCKVFDYGKSRSVAAVLAARLVRAVEPLKDVSYVLLGYRCLFVSLLTLYSFIFCCRHSLGVQPV